jgi:hypothetical protein
MKTKLTVFIAVLVMTLIFTSCSTQSSTSDAQTKSDQAASNLKADNTEKINDEFIEKYITSLDVCLIGPSELLFDDPALIPTNTLKMFFLYYINSEKPRNGEKYYGEKWYNESDKKYHIPVSEMEAVWSCCFGKYTLNKYQLDNYNKEKDEMVTPLISGFGGDRKIKVTDKQFISEDTAKITVDFLNDSGDVYYTKVYTLKIKGDGVTYLSVLKNYEKSKSPVSVIALKYGVIGYAKDKKLYNIWSNNTSVLSPGVILQQSIVLTINIKNMASTSLLKIITAKKL